MPENTESQKLRVRCCKTRPPQKRRNTHRYRGAIDGPMDKLLAGECEYILITGDEFGRQSIRSTANYIAKKRGRKVSSYVDARGRLIVHIHPDDRIANGAPA